MTSTELREKILAMFESVEKNTVSPDAATGNIMHEVKDHNNNLPKQDLNT